MYVNISPLLLPLPTLLLPPLPTPSNPPSYPFQPPFLPAFFPPPPPPPPSPSNPPSYPPSFLSPFFPPPLLPPFPIFLENGFNFANSANLSSCSDPFDSEGRLCNGQGVCDCGRCQCDQVCLLLLLDIALHHYCLSIDQ